jgi:hypothetical protein
MFSEVSATSVQKIQVLYARPALLQHQIPHQKFFLKNYPRERSQERETPLRNSLRKAILIQLVLKLFPNTSQEVPSLDVLQCPGNPDLSLMKPDL